LLYCVKISILSFRSNGAAQAMFLRHEGFLGALGAFMSYEKHGLDDLMVHQLVERFPMGAPYTGGNIHGPPLRDLNEKARERNWKTLMFADHLFEKMIQLNVF